MRVVITYYYISNVVLVLLNANARDYVIKSYAFCGFVSYTHWLFVFSRAVELCPIQTGII